MKKPSKFFSIFTSAVLAVFLVTGSIAVPILCRGFYYSQVQSLDLPARTGYSQATIQESFDEVMDYLVKDAPFGTGDLKWSESGRSHFADCRFLFQLELQALKLTAALLLVILILVWTKRLTPYRFWGRGPCFWAFAGLGAVVLILGLWGLLDFESLFTAFHTLFFPGKTNWIFDWRTDEIILILPEPFWARTAALVAGLTFGTGSVLAVLEEVLYRIRQPKSVYDDIREM